jgi:hypothetical protein
MKSDTCGSSVLTLRNMLISNQLSRKTLQVAVSMDVGDTKIEQTISPRRGPVGATHPSIYLYWPVSVNPIFSLSGSLAAIHRCDCSNPS